MKIKLFLFLIIGVICVLNIYASPVSTIINASICGELQNDLDYANANYGASCSAGFSSNLLDNGVNTENQSISTTGNYGGIRVGFNTTLNHCVAPTNISFCSRWYYSGAGTCMNISFTTNGTGNKLGWTDIGGCSNNASTNMVCTDLTNIINWSCSNFSDGNLYVRTLMSKTAGANVNISNDVLYFNITYNTDMVMNNVSLTPNIIYKNDTLQGYCNATSNYTITQFNFSWYKNNVLSQSSNIISNYISNNNYNIVNFSNNNSLYYSTNFSFNNLILHQSVSYIQNAYSINFNNNGTLLFIGNYGLNKIMVYNLTTPYDINTQTFDYEKPISNGGFTKEILGVLDISFNSNGSSLYVSDGSNIYQYQLTSPYNISIFNGSKFVDKLPVSSATGTRCSEADTFALNNDGTKIFLLCTNNKMYELNLSTPYNVSTYTYKLEKALPISGTPGSLRFSKDGSRLFESIRLTGMGYEYYLHTNFSINSIYYVQSYYIDTKFEPQFVGMTFNDVGSKLYTYDYSNGLINEYNVTQTIFNANIFKNDNITFSCNAYDGVDYSGWSNSSILTVQNSVPIIVSSTFNPSTAFKNSTVQGVCNASDIDGDLISYNYSLYLNNVNNLSTTTTQSYCYQESANTTNQSGIDGSCGLNYTGNYVISPFSDGNTARITDGSWTQGSNSDIPISMLLNYSKPTNEVNHAILQIRYSMGINSYLDIYCQNNFIYRLQTGGIGKYANISIPTYCLNENILSLTLNNPVSTLSITVYEEAIYWGIINYQNFTNINKGNNLTFQCQAFDGTNYSDILNSSQLTIQNSPPYITNLSFSQATYYLGQLIQPTWVFNDIDGDSDSSFWYLFKNQVLNLSGQYNSTSLSFGNFNVGNNITFNISGYDGFNYSLTNYTTNITIQDVNLSVTINGNNYLNYTTTRNMLTTFTINLQQDQNTTLNYTLSNNHNNSLFYTNYSIINTQLVNTTTTQITFNTTTLNVIGSNAYNLTLTRDFDQRNFTIPINIVITGTAANLHINNLSNLNNWNDGSNRLINVSNTGDNNASQCTIIATNTPSGLSNYLISPTFSLNINQSLNINISYSTSTSFGDVNTLNVICQNATDIGTSVSSSSGIGYSIVYIAPTVIPPAGGGGGGSPTTIIQQSVGVLGDLTIEPSNITLSMTSGSIYNGEIKITNTGLLNKNISIEKVGNVFVTFDQDVSNLIVPTSSGVVSNFIYVRYTIKVPVNQTIGQVLTSTYVITDLSTDKTTNLVFSITIRESLFNLLLTQKDFFNTELFSSKICLEPDTCSKSVTVNLTYGYALLGLIFIVLIIVGYNVHKRYKK